jgi:hypothetical protein
MPRTINQIGVHQNVPQRRRDCITSRHTGALPSTYLPACGFLYHTSPTVPYLQHAYVQSRHHARRRPSRQLASSHFYAGQPRPTRALRMRTGGALKQNATARLFPGRPARMPVTARAIAVSGGPPGVRRGVGAARVRITVTCHRFQRLFVHHTTLWWRCSGGGLDHKPAALLRREQGGVVRTYVHYTLACQVDDLHDK